MKKLISMVAVLVTGVACYALPLDLYNDTILQENGGIVATPNWDNAGTWLNWSISEVEPGLWHYEYVWHTDGADLSHIAIELTEGAVASDFSNWQFTYSGVELGDPTFGWVDPSTGNSNPGMPGMMYGLILNTDPSVPVFGFSFDTWRSPVWGDFYAKDGKQNRGGPDGGFTYAYNAGFLAADANDGYHIARPNGMKVADGGLTVALLGAALMGIEAIRRRMLCRS